MAYQKTNWVNGYTPLNASNMNKIEEGIFNNDTFLSSLNVRVEDLEGSIGQGGIESVVVSGNGNALNNASYNPSTKILNFEKNNTFALDSDLDSVNNKNLYHLGAFDSVSGNVITRQTGYLSFNVNDTKNWIKETFTTIVRYHTTFEVDNNIVSNIPIGSDIGDIVPTNNGWFYINKVIYVYAKNNDFSNIKNGLFQYKLETSYPETIIEDRPLTTLDQSGSQWVREEWEKGLNLLQEDISKVDNWNIKLGYVNLKAGVTYNLWTDVTFPNGQKAVLKDRNNNIIAFVGYTFGGNNYFTLSNSYSGEINLSGTFPNVNPTKAMLNVGNHPYPYQRYQGGIVREKQLNDKLNFKIFDASNSTMNDVLDYIHQNYEHIISIIYYARSGGEAFGSNVIYNADEGILAYITSGLTFANVQLNTDAEEGSDYIIIYKQY